MYWNYLIDNARKQQVFWVIFILVLLYVSNALMASEKCYGNSYLHIFRAAKCLNHSMFMAGTDKFVTIQLCLHFPTLTLRILSLFRINISFLNVLNSDHSYVSDFTI